MKPLLQSCTAVVLAALLASGATLSVPVDPELAKQIQTAANSARAEANYSAALREYRRLLEVYPNEPGLQAPIYLAMSDAAEKSGDSAQAKQFAAMSKALDPTLETRIAAGAAAATQTRGERDRVGAALAILSAAAGTISAVRDARRQAAQQQQAMQPQAMAPQQAYAYPPAPYGQPGYQPPPGNSYAPMPGYADPNAVAQQQPAAQYAPPPQGQPQYGAPQGQPQYAPPQGQPQYAPPQGQPQYAPPQGQPQYAPPQGQPQYAPPQGQPQYAAQAQYPQQQGYYPPPPPAPYGAPPNYQMPVTRGEKAAVVRVVHDHSRAGDKAYFADGCGALLAVEGGSLVFTPGGGEAPRVIPSAEIAEIRLNAAIGRNVGAFHIVTKRGLYLDLAPDTGNRDDGRADVESLRKQLGIAE